MDVQAPEVDLVDLDSVTLVLFNVPVIISKSKKIHCVCSIKLVLLCY